LQKKAALPVKLPEKIGPLFLPPHPLERIDQSVGGGVVGMDGIIVPQLGEDVLCHLLAQLNPPLIEAEDVPDKPLHEDLMLIQGD